MNKNQYPNAYPHGPIVRIADEVFMVRGSIRMNPLIRITRNMVVVRQGKDLTLINPIRLNTEGEQALKNLGRVQNVLRLGAFHGLDDPYYVNEFGATFWCQEGGQTYTKPDIDVVVSSDTVLPFDHGKFVEFKGIREPEGVILIERGEGLLLTCDAIQHYGDYQYNNLLARLMLPFIGFPKTTLVGPIWLKRMHDDPQSLKPEFDRLLNLEFDSLAAAHGSFLPTGAKDAVRRAIERAFPGQ